LPGSWSPPVSSPPAGREWLATLDINPLVYGPDGFGAVDALLLRDPRV
jgi:hypothetical protein